MKKKLEKYNVIVFDVNHKTFESYDVLPYLRSCLNDRLKRFKSYKRTKEYKEGHNVRKEKLFPDNFSDLKDFIKCRSMYMFWSRCEYEIILNSWPSLDISKKIDVHEQIMMNIDIITQILFEEYINYMRKY